MMTTLHLTNAYHRDVVEICDKYSLPCLAAMLRR
jgi:hypothetical protein